MAFNLLNGACMRIQQTVMLMVLLLAPWLMAPRCDGDPQPAELAPASVIAPDMNMQLAAPLHGNFAHSELRVIVPTYDAPAAFDHRLRGLFTEYEKLAVALFDRDVDGARANAAAMRAAVAKPVEALMRPEARTAWEGHRMVLETSLHQLEQASSIDTQLKHFSHMSEALYCAVRSFDVARAPIYVSYCPMALSNHGAYWLSSSAQGANPYMGAESSECGELVETIGANTPDPADRHHH